MSPWTNYTFRVIARNKVGDSLPSGHSKVCLTPEDVPYKNPDNVIGRGTAPLGPGYRTGASQADMSLLRPGACRCDR